MADYSNDFSDLKDAFKGVFSGVSGIAKDLAATAGDKAKSVGRIAKLTLDLNAEKNGVEKVYSEIGRLYYETYKQEPGDFFIRLFDEASLAESNIAAMEAELAELKSSVREAVDDMKDSFESAVEECEAECCGEDGIEVEIIDETPADQGPENK